MKMNEKVMLSIYLSPANVSLLNGREVELSSFYRCPTIVIPLSDKKKSLAEVFSNLTISNADLETRLLESCDYSDMVKPNSLFTLYVGDGDDKFEGVTCTTLAKLNLLDNYPLTTSMSAFENAGYTVEELILYYFMTGKEFEYLWIAVSGIACFENADEDDLTFVYA
tara:strand:- start:244 stop:744 length:501 start_codon:yes stop_codon:yes gene_type:complete